MLLWDMKKLNMMVVCEWYSLNRKTSKLKLDTAVVQDTQEYSAWACLGTVELRPSPKHPDYQFAEPAQLAKLDAAAELAEDATKPPPKKKAGKKESNAQRDARYAAAKAHEQAEANEIPVNYAPARACVRVKSATWVGIGSAL